MAALVGTVLLSGKSISPTGHAPIQDTTQWLIYPENVMAIVENKCLGCHKPDSRNEKAKEKWQWKKLTAMDTMDVAAAMDELLEVLAEGSMPPEKMLEKYPDKKLTDDETAVLRDWAEATLGSLLDE